MCGKYSSKWAACWVSVGGSVLLAGFACGHGWCVWVIYLVGPGWNLYISLMAFDVGCFYQVEMGL